MSTRAYELRDSVDPELFGGSVTSGDGTIFDVGAALEDGGGVIGTDDEALIVALDSYEPLKRVAVPESTKKEKASSTTSKSSTTNEGKAS